MSRVNESESHPLPQFVKASGATDSERYLQMLCQRSFLSLWSHAGIYRDQGRVNGIGHGKEVCDLLVVFGDNIIIFSDKDCRFGESDDAQLNWSRWFRKAIEASASQIRGAESSIRQHPDNLFIDRSCTMPFPYAIPEMSRAVFHRVVVAHGVSKHCEAAFGDSGSLLIDSEVSGEGHYQKPFTVGDLDKSKGFIHVLDDTTLDIVMETLSTLSDFVAYLSRKEKLIRSRHVVAAGEEELLAVYMRSLDSTGEHDFVLPKGDFMVAIPEGEWRRHEQSPSRRKQLLADKGSYAWDYLIEKFTNLLMTQTQYYSSENGSIQKVEVALRFMARERRTRRRLLTKLWIDLIENTPPDKQAVRISKSLSSDEPHYVFFLFPYPSDIDDDTYRLARRNYLNAYCRVTKHRFPEASHIVGLATETLSNNGGSEDLLYMDVADWTKADDDEAASLMQKLGLLKEVKEFSATEYEFPSGDARVQVAKHPLM